MAKPVVWYLGSAGPLGGVWTTTPEFAHDVPRYLIGTIYRATQGCWAEFRVAPAGAAPARNMECSGERGVCDKDEGYRSSKDVVKNIRARTEGRYLERPDTCTVQHTKHDCCSRSGRVASAWTCVLHAAFSEPT